MKKRYLLLLIMFLPFLVFAKDYEISNINLKFSIDDNWDVFIANNLDKDLIDKYGLTKEEMEYSMSNQNVYVDAVSNNQKIEFFVIIPDVNLEIHNLSNYPDGLVMETSKELAKTVNTDNYSQYSSTKHKFAVLNYKDEKNGYYVINYYTIVNAKGYNFQFQKSNEITKEEINDFSKIIDTIEISSLEEYKNESEELQKEIDEYNRSGFNWKNILIDALIGGAVGGISAVILKLLKRKKEA